MFPRVQFTHKKEHVFVCWPAVGQYLPKHPHSELYGFSDFENFIFSCHFEIYGKKNPQNLRLTINLMQKHIEKTS
jgi:hypothetical protein